jgi:hypothetical protein
VSGVARTPFAAAQPCCGPIRARAFAVLMRSPAELRDVANFADALAAIANAPQHCHDRPIETPASPAWPSRSRRTHSFNLEQPHG